MQLTVGDTKFDVLRGELTPNATMPIRMRIWMMEGGGQEKEDEYSIVVEDFKYQ